MMQIGHLSGLTPTVNFASRDFAGAGTEWGIRVIPDCQLFYVISGRAEMILGPTRYPIVTGECVFYGAESPHLLKTMSGVEYYSLHFHWHHPSPEPIHPAHGIRYVDKRELASTARTYKLDIPGQGEITVPHLFSVPGLESILLRIVKEYQLELPGYGFVLRAYIMELIALLCRHLLVKSKSAATDKIEPALNAMCEQPDKMWSVTELAKLCGYHPVHFTTVFKNETGKNPKQYMIAERIKKAKQALLNGEKMQVIASRLGFTSLHYFSHHFKKETGLTPTDFRQRGVEESDAAIRLKRSPYFKEV